MSVEELKDIDAKTIPVGRLLHMIGKGYMVYINSHMKKFGINTTQLHLLFEIRQQSDINQEKIAQRCSINKGAVARSIKKLEENGFVIRQIDENNRRQNKLSLTKKGEETLNESIEVLKRWENEVIKKEGYITKELLQQILKEIAIKTMELNEEDINNG